MLKLLMKKSMKRITALILVFCMIFCSNAFSGLSKIYAEEKTLESEVSSEENIKNEELTINEEVAENKELTENDDLVEDEEPVDDEELVEPVEYEEPVEDEDPTENEERITTDEIVDEETTTNFDDEESIIENATSSEIQYEEDIIEDIKEEEEEEIKENVDDNISTMSEIEYLDIDLDILSTNKSLVATISEVKIVATYSELIQEDEDYGLLLPDYTAPVAITEFEGIFGATTLEESLDMRDEVNESGFPVLPDVRNQGAEGFCWAFSTVGLVETYLRKHGIINAAPDAAESNLSEAALGYFVLKGLQSVTAAGSENIDEPGLEGNDYTISQLLPKNKGGNQLEASLIASSYMGFVVEDETLNYDIDLVNAMFNDTTGAYDKYAFKNNAYELTNVKFINKSNTDIIKQAIKENGAVGINYREARNRYNCHQHDYKERTGEWFNYLPYDKNVSSNHAVMAVGWDDNIPKEYFKYDDGSTVETPEHNGGWLIRNSWGHGNDYMNDGYFWLSYDDPYIENTFYAIEAAAANTYKYNYHYDTTSNNEFYPFNKVGYQAANIFKVSDVANQSLDAVSVALNSTNASLTVKIYTNDEQMSSPIDGTLVATQDASFDTAGIYTIPLSNKVALFKGTYYSIIIETKTSSMSVFTDISGESTAISKGAVVVARTHVNECEPGQSFYGIAGNPNYIDVSSDSKKTNFRIKGLTNDALFINFNGNGADNIMPAQFIDTVGATVNINENALTRKGYTFAGWKDADGNEYEDKAPITVSASVELIAQWTPVVYRINYNTNGGTIADGTTYFNKTYGVTYPETLKQPTKNGYKFAGWQTDAELTKQYYRNQDVIYVDGTLEYTIYAKWEERTYTITYMNLTDVTWATGYPVTERLYTQEITLPTAEHITRKTDTCVWRFDGWYNNSTFTGDRVYQIPANTLGDKTYYAKWTLKQTFQFNLNSHGTQVDTQYINPGEKVIKPTDPTDERWVFEYWYETNEDTPYDFETAVSSPRVTARVLYAKWRPKQEFVFNMNGHGTQVPSQLLDLGEFVTKPADPTAEGWTFLYWYEINQDIEFDFTEVILNTSSVARTIYARWSPLNYTIKYYDDKGTEITGYVDNYDSGSSITLPVLAETEDKVFDGWYNNSSYTGNKITKITPTDIGNIVLYAKYVNKLTVTFNAGENGQGTMQPQKIIDGVSTALSENKFERSGYTFSGWTGSDKKTYVDKEKVVLHSDLTLTAIWEKNKSGGGGNTGGGGGGGGNTIPQTKSTNTISDVKIEGSLKSIPVNYGTANATWSQDLSGKWSLNVMNQSGIFEEAKNTFACITSYVVDAAGQTVPIQDFYYFDSNGDMYTGWLRDSENTTYYFEVVGADIGKLKHGWAPINGNYYYFDSEGKMMRNTVTPDGYVVDVEGKWLGQPT